MATETVFSRAILFPYPTFRQGESPLESENVRFQKRTQPVPAASVNRHDRTAKHCIQGRGSATGHLTDQRDRTDPPPHLLASVINRQTAFPGAEGRDIKRPGTTLDALIISQSTAQHNTPVSRWSLTGQSFMHTT